MSQDVIMIDENNEDENSAEMDSGSRQNEESNPPLNNDSNPPNNQDENRIVIDEIKEIVKSQTKNSSMIQTQGEEKNLCSICLDPWTSMGEHRICTLKCGHIFGRKCVERWLGTKIKSNPSCPQCNSKARRSDIINLYVTNLSAIDNSQIEQLQKQIIYFKTNKSETEKSLYHANLKMNMLTTEVDMLRNENAALKRKLSIVTSSTFDASDSTISSIHYTEFKNFPICKQNGCRIMNVHPNNKLVLISKISENQHLFPGYGICKLNLELATCKNYSTEYVRLHKTRIRDMSISTHDPSNLLSCSLDRSLKITNLTSNTCAQEYHNTFPFWSCIWNSENGNVIHAGLANGTVVTYDIRNTIGITDSCNLMSVSLSVQTVGSPVVSIKPIKLRKNSKDSISGLVAATFENVYFIEKKEEKFIPHLILQPVGQIVSIDVNSTQEYCVISQRPRGYLKNCQQLVGEFEEVIFEENDPQYMFTLKSTLEGSKCQKLLSRSTIYSPSNNDDMFVAFGNEDKSSIQIYNLKNNSFSLIPSKYGNIVDIAPLWFNDWHYLLGLTESSLTMFKYVI